MRAPGATDEPVAPKCLPRPPRRDELLAAIADLLKLDGAELAPLFGVKTKEHQAPAHRADKALRILIVDDNQTNLDVTQIQLSILGHHVDAVSNALQALQHWRSHDYALIITDCRMPDMDGLELAAAIRREEVARQRARTPIIALTANVLVGEADRVRAAGMDDYLGKPVDIVALSDAITRCLGEASRQDEALNANMSDADAPQPTTRWLWPTAHSTSRRSAPRWAAT